MKESLLGPLEEIQMYREVLTLTLTLTLTRIGGDPETEGDVRMARERSD